ncbi:MAG TPA: TonB-dependent receptor [Vicinamibacterales bacterium]|nr:TonB-dependent receptor [Vicinamibacterales bacterium]
MPTRLTVFSTLILLLAAASARAQSPYRQTVVVTAAATPVELGSITRTMTIITREQIEALPAHTIADVLRLAPSVDVRARGIMGVQTDFAIRGANFGQMLVLVDGVRLNDAQSGHHNGDIPVPLDAVERIEILQGPGSAIFGADAFGGTVNVITRRTAPASFQVRGGADDYASGSGQWGFERGGASQLLSVAADRSSGFMYDRDFKNAIVRSRTSFGRSTVSLSYLWKGFGANNFYGGNAPSREWTNQTLLAAEHGLGAAAGWNWRLGESYRTHGDHFIFNQTNPALSDNRHRSHALLATVAGSRPVWGGTATVGVEGGGDWIRSTNLGNHSTLRVSGFGEWRRPIAQAAQIDATLRVDRYDEFGTSLSPSLGAGWWPAPRLRLRASVGRAFRVPTFTERFYSDPANLARAEVGPEHAWAGEGGADIFLGRDWAMHATLFGRADHDVIDWLRPTTTVRWQTYNVRDVNTKGVELSVSRSLAPGGFVQVGYTGLDLDASAVDQLSKYVLDFAPHSFTAAASIPLPASFQLAPRLEVRERRRPYPVATGGTALGDRGYALFDLRLARRFGAHYEVAVEGTNLFDVSYQEIAGVAMPGAKWAVSLAVR